MRVGISIGDVNGIGLEVLLKSHQEIVQICEPIYCVDPILLKRAAELLGMELPKNMSCIALDVSLPNINPGCITKESGDYSYTSFLKALELVKSHKVEAISTLPIHKKAWHLAGVSYVGHTEALRDIFKKEAIMVLGSPKLYVALFSDHIPLRDVPDKVSFESLLKFLIQLSSHIHKPPCGVLGLNPHAGDFGILGDEEVIISRAIKEANAILQNEIFLGPLVPDTAFVGNHLCYYVAMYHDQGLIPLKTLYFEESINLTLNLPAVRTSVDHGTAFDIAYKNKANNKSYLQAIKEAVKRASNQNVKDSCNTDFEQVI
ncbi:MAG: 4-hydroxythreonine-4-phosphate dehydrogenase [Helicobacter sp.]|nr:4-hydroxythreonine-4-phosphate dehydrogenase [Helicobacter sp.]